MGPSVDFLNSVLLAIENADQDYDRRYGLILLAMYLANELGMNTGYRLDPNEPDWPVAFIELPTGQVSWHMPQFSEPWDGHSTAEKYERIRRFVQKRRIGLTREAS